MGRNKRCTKAALAALLAIKAAARLNKPLTLRSSSKGAKKAQSVRIPRRWTSRLCHAPSRIAGRGCFVRCAACGANKRGVQDDPRCTAGRAHISSRAGTVVFDKGDVVGLYYGREVSGDATGDYVLRVNDKLCLDAATSLCVSRYINHRAANPNVRFARGGVRNGRVVVEIKAVRRVREHDELLAHYGTGYIITQS